MTRKTKYFDLKK